MNSQLPAPFVVNPELVRDIQALLQNLATRSRYTTLTVSVDEFPAWLVALGRDDFHAYMSKNGHRFISSGMAHIVKTVRPDEMRIVSVSCDTPPAPWVSFPEAEGDRRYMFRYTTNVLPDNETESE